MVTLQAYVLRELLKAFALTLAALTALFTMGGGLYNVLRYEGIGGGELLGFLPMLIPIVVTLTMPVAALFATSMVYGRLAADNELLACRAAGVNIHRLFGAAVLLSVFVAGFTLLFGDLVIPDFVRRLDRFARTNLRDIALQKMQVMGHVRYERNRERYLLTARRAHVPSSAALRQQALPTEAGVTYLLVEEPVFLHIDGQDHLVRYASAQHGLCQFDARSSPIELTIYVDAGRDFDVRGQSVALQRQQIGPITIPLEFPRKSSMVDLATLVRWRDRPWEVDRVRPQVRAFLLELARERFAADCEQRLERGEALTLASERGQPCTIMAGRCQVEARGVVLSEARVEQPGPLPGRPLRYEAPRAVLGPQPAATGQLRIELELREAGNRPILEHNPRAADYAQGRERAGFSLADDLLLPPAVTQELESYTEEAVFDPGVALPAGPTLSEKRSALQQEGAKQRRKMSAVIHFRLGFSSSALVTVLMAAALGVIFRGARALAAFGLACVPFGSVSLLMVMARHLGENEGTAQLGPALTWGGLAGLALADGLILRLGVRR